MGWKATEAVWNHSKSTGAARLVMLCLAKHANDHGACYPSLKTIAELTAVSRRQVSRAVKELHEAGEIRYIPGNGRGNRSHYVILLPIGKDDTVSSNSAEKDDMVSKKGDTMSRKDDMVSRKDDTMSPESIKNHKESIYESGRTHGGISEKVDNGLNRPDPDRIALETDMLSAITAVVKTVYVPHENKKDFEGARDALIELGITPEQVTAFKDWWRDNGYYDGPPALKTLRDEIKASINGAGAYHDDLDDFQAYDEPMEVSDG